MINAGTGILPGSTAYSLGVSQKLIDAISSYTSLGVINNYVDLYNNVSWVNYTTEYNSFKQIGLPQFLALTDKSPDTASGAIPGHRERWFSDLVLYTARRDMCYLLIEGTGPTRDLTKFAQLYGICAGYRAQANEMLNSMENTKAIEATFTSMEDLSTGNISQITDAYAAHGQDLVNLGTLVNLKFLAQQGYPSTLLRQILSKGGMLPGITAALQNQGVTPEALVTLIDSTHEVPVATEKLMYVALTQVRDADLALLTKLLDITTTGLVTAADLLNPAKLFPNSYQSLRMRIPGGNQVKIYDGQQPTPALGEYFIDDDNYQTLSKVIPADWALAMMAWAFSVSQVKNISTSDFVKFAESVKATNPIGTAGESNSPLNINTVATVNSSIASGTGPHGTITIFDMLGTAAGYPHIEKLTDIVAKFNTLDFTELTSAYSDIALWFTEKAAYDAAMAQYQSDTETYQESVAQMQPGDPLPTAPTEPTKPEILNFTLAELVAIASEQADLVIANNPATIEEIKKAWDAMGQQLTTEFTNQTDAEVEYDELKLGSKPSALSFITGIPTLAKDKEPRGAYEFFKAVVDETTPGGQGFLAALNEAQNNEAMAKAGIQSDTQLSSAP